MMRKKMFGIVVALAFVTIVLILILTPTLFTIKNVEITGNYRLDDATVLKLAALEQPTNIIVFSTRQAEKSLLKNPYLDQVDIQKHLWDRTVTLTIKERVLSGYVEYVLGTFLCIDENGRVLAVSSAPDEKLPVVVGLDFKTFTVGQILDVTNKKSFETMVTLAHLFNKYDLETDVIKVSLQDADNTHIYVNNIDVELGDIKDADEKIRTLKVVVQTLDDKDVKGFLDLKDISKPARFQMLT